MLFVERELRLPGPNENGFGRNRTPSIGLGCSATVGIPVGFPCYSLKKPSGFLDGFFNDMILLIISHWQSHRRGRQQANCL
jgi:hypothetical protein